VIAIEGVTAAEPSHDELAAREGADRHPTRVTADTVRAVGALDVSPEQRGFLAPNAVDAREYDLWRFMIADGHQGAGTGGGLSISSSSTSAGFPAPASSSRAPCAASTAPRGFYLRYGFEETGGVEGDERVIRLTL
jgi:hypothetical protein